MPPSSFPSCFFFFNDTATTEIYTLSLHDALPISCPSSRCASSSCPASRSDGWSSPTTSRRSPSSCRATGPGTSRGSASRSEEHTSELQSRLHLVCRLLLEKKKKKKVNKNTRPPTH